MPDDKLDRRFDAIEARLARLEALITPPILTPPPPPMPEPVAPEVPLAVVAPETVIEFATRADEAPTPEAPTPDVPTARSETPSPAIHAPTPDWVMERQAALARIAAESRDTSARPTTPAAVPYAAARPAPATPGAGSLERALGGKWTAWLGALILVIGAGLGLKFAYDQGWLGGLPPAARLAIWALASLGLVGLGELALRRVSRLASVGPFAAGLGSLFLVAYAGYGYFDLYSPGTAFALTCVAAVLGAFISARADLLSIALLTLLGAHLAPVVLGGDSGLSGFVTYLVSLQVVALMLAGRGGGASQRWWTLRWLSLAAAAGWAFQIQTTVDGVPVALVVYALLTAALAHGELVVSGLRRRLQIHGPLGQLDLYPLAATAFASTVTYLHLPAGDWRALAAGAIAWAVLGLGAEALARLAARRDGDAALLRLDHNARLQSLSVLALGLFHGLASPYHLLAAAGVGLALAVYTARRPDDLVPARRHFSGSAAVLFPLAAAGRFALAAWGLLETPPPVAGLSAATLGLACAAAAIASALIAAGRGARYSPSPSLSAVPSLVWLPLAFAVGTPATGVLLTLGLAWFWTLPTLLPTAPRLLTLKPELHARGLLAAAGVLWLLFVALGPRLDPAYAGAAERVLFNPTALTGLLLAASVIAIPKLLRRGIPLADLADSPSLRTLATTAVAIALVFVVGLLELDRAVLHATDATAQRWPLSVHPHVLRGLLAAAWASACLGAWAVFARRSPGVLAASALLVVPVAAGATLAHCASLASGQANPVANVAVVLSLVTLAVALFYGRLLRHHGSGASAVACLSAATLLFFAGAAEVIRYGSDAGSPLLGFPDWYATLAALTLWAISVALGVLLAARRFARDWTAYPALAAAAQTLLLLAAAKSLLADQFVPWAVGLTRFGTPIANLQLFTAAAVIAALLAAWFLRKRDGRSASPGFGRLAVVLGTLLAFVATSAESARCLRAVGLSMSVSDVRLLVLAGYSVWWALLALGAVLLGFRLRLAPVRYAGLALFAITLLKVVFVDLAGAGPGWRVLSFLGLGAVLLLTSVLYAKLAPLLLSPAASEPPAADKPPA